MPFHKQKQNVKIVTFYHVLTPAPHGPTLKQKSSHTKRVITSNCTKFLKYTHKMLLLEIMQNASSTTRYFFLIAEVSTNFSAIPRRSWGRGVARKCVMLKPNTFFQLKLLVFHNFFSERPVEIPYLKKSR